MPAHRAKQGQCSSCVSVRPKAGAWCHGLAAQTLGASFLGLLDNSTKREDERMCSFITGPNKLRVGGIYFGFLSLFPRKVLVFSPLFSPCLPMCGFYFWKSKCPIRQIFIFHKFFQAFSARNIFILESFHPLSQRSSPGLIWLGFFGFFFLKSPLLSKYA